MKHRITIIADIQPDDVFGFKECLEMYLEQYGDSRVIDVSPIDSQTKIRKDDRNGRNH